MNKRIHVVVIIVALLSISVPFTRAYSCDDRDQRQQAYHAALTELEQLNGLIPFVEQFDLVQRTIREINDTLSATAKETAATSAKINKLRSLIGATDERLQESLSQAVWARSVARNPAERAERDSTESTSEGAGVLGKTASNLSKAESMMKDVLMITQRAETALNVLDRALAAREGSPSEQLRAFQEYFTTLIDVIGPIAKSIPGLSQLFELYVGAIEWITTSVESIQESNRERDRILRQYGYNDMTWNWQRTTPSERLAQARQEAEKTLEAAAGRLLDCDEKLALQSGSDPLNSRIEKARSFANVRCNEMLPSLVEGWRERDRQFDELHRFYPRPSLFDPVRYGNSLDANEELALARRKFQRQKAEWTVDIQREELKKLETILAKAESAQKAVEQLSEKHDDCRRRWLETEASAQNWPKWKIMAANSDLYPDWYKRLDEEFNATQSDNGRTLHVVEFYNKATEIHARIRTSGELLKRLYEYPQMREVAGEDYADSVKGVEFQISQANLAQELLEREFVTIPPFEFVQNALSRLLYRYGDPLIGLAWGSELKATSYLVHTLELRNKRQLRAFTDAAEAGEATDQLVKRELEHRAKLLSDYRKAGAHLVRRRVGYLNDSCWLYEYAKDVHFSEIDEIRVFIYSQFARLRTKDSDLHRRIFGYYSDQHSALDWFYGAPANVIISPKFVQDESVWHFHRYIEVQPIEYLCELWTDAEAAKLGLPLYSNRPL